MSLEEHIDLHTNLKRKFTEDSEQECNPTKRQKITNDSKTRQQSFKSQRILWKRKRTVSVQPKPEAEYVGPRFASYTFGSDKIDYSDDPNEKLLSVALQPEVQSFLSSLTRDQYAVSFQYKEQDHQIAHMSGTYNKIDNDTLEKTVHRETKEELRVEVKNPAEMVQISTETRANGTEWAFFHCLITNLEPVIVDTDSPEKKDDNKRRKVGCIYTGTYSAVQNLINDYSALYASSAKESKSSDNIIGISFFRVDVALEACKLIEDKKKTQPRGDYTPVKAMI